MVLTNRQSLAWAYLTSDDALLSVLYGGAKGGGKSHFLCAWACAEAMYLAKLFDLPKSEDPLVVGFLGRKRGVDFTNTTLATWLKVIPYERYTIKEQKKHIVIDDRVAILFGGLDDQSTINKFNSAEYAFAGIDQAEETAQADVSVLAGALRLKINGIQPRYRMFYTANPAECWLKSEFDVTQGESVKLRTMPNGEEVKYAYIPALYTDNEHLPSNYETTLEMAFGYDEALLSAYKQGDWSIAHDSDFVVTRGMLELLKQKTVLPKDTITVTALDPSIGGDECVMYAMRNGAKIAEKITHEKNPMVIAADFVKFSNDYNAVLSGIDSCGLGIGIAQRCKDLKLNVLFIQSAEKATDERCKIVRDEVWLTLREAVQKNELQPLRDNAIIDQLCVIKFSQKLGKFKVAGKDAIKPLLGCSPDRGDCYAYLVYTYYQAKKRHLRNNAVDLSDMFNTDNLGHMAC